MGKARSGERDARDHVRVCCRLLVACLHRVFVIADRCDVSRCHVCVFQDLGLGVVSVRHQRRSVASSWSLRAASFPGCEAAHSSCKTRRPALPPWRRVVPANHMTQTEERGWWSGRAFVTRPLSPCIHFCLSDPTSKQFPPWMQRLPLQPA